MEIKSGTTEGRGIVKAGKLVKVLVSFDGERIERIRITGDFFLYPEESIEELESSLVGAKLEDVREIAEDVLKDKEAVGIDAESLSKAVMLAWKSRN